MRMMILLAIMLAGCVEGREPASEPSAQPPVQPAPVPSAAVQPQADTSPAGEAAPDSVDVVFTRGEQPVTRRRAVQPGNRTIRGALEWLVRGPDDAEEADGIRSWFSDETSSALSSVNIDGDGNATVDFRDLRPLIPNASTSAGSAMLLHELNGTVFQFPNVRSVEYRMNGSCALFWEWLQRSCHVEKRP